jgi:hypothetical protein
MEGGQKYHQECTYRGTMNAPSYLQDHPAMHALHEDLAAALTDTPFTSHATHLAFRAVMHASAWLSADLPRSPYYATDQGIILYYRTFAPEGVPALDAHLAALWNGHALTPAGLALYADLHGHPCQPKPETGRSNATSLWLNHLQLLTRYGLNFDQRLRTAHDAA